MIRLFYRIGRVITVIGVIATFLWGCDHVNELDGVRLDPDRAIDEFSLSNECTEVDLSATIQNKGIVDVVGVAADNVFALSVEGTGYRYNGQKWQETHLAPEPDYGSMSMDGVPRTEYYYLGLSLSLKQDQLLLRGIGQDRAEYVQENGSSEYIWFLQYKSLGDCCSDMVPPDYAYNDSSDKLVWYSAFVGVWAEDYVLVGGSAIIPADNAEGGPSDRLKGTTESGSRLDICDNENGCRRHTGAPDVPLVDAWGTSTGDFYIIGNRIDHENSCHLVRGEIYHCNKSHCLLEATTEGTLLSGIWGASQSEIFVAGGLPAFGDTPGRSIVLMRNDTRWSQIETDTEVPLNAVWGDAGNLFVVGGFRADDATASSIAMRYDGAAWHVLDLGATSPLHAVWGVAPADVHLVGEEGFFHYPSDDR